MPEFENTRKVHALKWNDGKTDTVGDVLADEVAVALEYNGVPYAVMLATPGDLADFALGFSLTESIIASYSEFYGYKIDEQADGICIAVEIAGECFDGLQEKRRNHTGCGVCGTKFLTHAVRQPVPVKSTVIFSPEMLQNGFEQMESLQKIRKQTGSTHAAAWMEAGGRVALVREDIGRHNALDKLVGALTTLETDFSQGAVLLTSRASYEMVQKCGSVGIGVLAAVSAPTALAVSVAYHANITLAGFVRAGSHTIYTHAERIR